MPNKTAKWWLSLAASSLLAFPAQAQVGATFKNQIIVGTTTNSCGSSYAGGIRWASPNLQYCDGTNWQNVGTGSAAGSTGQAQFNNAGVLGADANYFWDNTNKRLGIGTATPTNTVQIVSSAEPQLNLKGTDVYGNTSLILTNSVTGDVWGERVDGSSNFSFAKNGHNAAYLDGYNLAFHVGPGAPLTQSNHETMSIVGGNTDPSYSILVVQGANSQSGDLQDWQNSSGTILDTINASGAVGVGTVSPATKLDVAGTIKVANGGETCGSTYAGGIRWASPNMQYCDGTNWLTINAATAGGITPGCGASGTLTTQTQNTLLVATGCSVIFKVWGAAGGGKSDAPASGGGGGYAGITLGPLSSATTYYLEVGGGGYDHSNGGLGGAGATGFTGGAGGQAQYGGGGGAASGVWTGAYGTSGTPVVIAGGGGGISYGGSTSTIAGCTGGSQNSSSIGGSAAGNYQGGGGGGGYPTGGASAVTGQETTPGFGGSCYAASGGGTIAGTGPNPGNAGDANYPSGAGLGVVGNGGNGAIYYQTY